MLVTYYTDLLLVFGCTQFENKYILSNTFSLFSYVYCSVQNIRNIRMCKSKECKSTVSSVYSNIAGHFFPNVYALRAG